MKTGKNFRIFGTRQSLLGDSIMSLPILTYLEKRYPDSYKIFHIAKKCSQAVPLYFNHPLIDRILISDCLEGFGPNDYEVMKTCDLVINTMPPHFDDRFPNDFDIYEETFRMSGLPIEEFWAMTEEEKRPKLVKWFDTENLGSKTLAFFACAGYGANGWSSRNPTKGWYEKLLPKLYAEGYTVYQFGHPLDYTFESHPQHVDCRQLVFFDQIKKALGTSIALATDSGTSLILGAYSHNQVSLLTNHWTHPRHVRNFYAFGTNNLNNHSFFGLNHCDNISQEEVLAKILEKTQF
jgi:ADP-heptose:LPS heptosyltransferase